LILSELERRSGKPCWELFDLIYGTSIGGIIGASLSLGHSAAETCDFFTTDGPQIFHQLFFGKDGIVEPRYPALPIEMALRKRMGMAKVSDAKTRLGIVSMNIAGAQVEPAFFKSWDSLTGQYLMWQACRATSAAQTYFPLFELDGMVLWDGGVVANSPAMCAYADAVKLWGDQEQVKVLSLGCGVSDSRFDAKGLINAGLLKVGLATLQVVLEGPSDAVDYQLRQMVGNDYYGIQPELIRSVAMDDTSQSAMDARRAAAAAALLQCSAALDEFY
jgi:hypothetical protein